ncbi:MAG: hypothetical protein AAB559_02675 [Patescibacteria group bacterium]
MSETTATTANTNKLTESAQDEALNRPVIGATQDGNRQKKLNEEIGLNPDVIKAKELLNQGKISIEEFERLTKKK